MRSWELKGSPDSSLLARHCLLQQSLTDSIPYSRSRKSHLQSYNLEKIKTGNMIHEGCRERRIIL